jgi:hypothetical protein
MLKVKLAAGTNSYWGFGIDFDPYDKFFQISFIHWYVGIEFWSKNAV